MSWQQSTINEACLLVTDGTHYTPPDVGQGIPFLTEPLAKLQGLAAWRSLQCSW